MLWKIRAAVLAAAVVAGTIAATGPVSAAPTTHQAESAALSGGARAEIEHAGYTGSGYAGGFTDANRGAAAVTVTTSGSAAGAHRLVLRYANGTGGTRTVTLAVNGGTRQLSLPATAGWASWGTVSQNVTLNAGANTLAVRYGSGDNGNVNIDSLSVEPVIPAAGVVEAESGTLSGGARAESEHGGHTGSGYVGGFVDANRGAAVTFTVTGTATRSSLALRYANGTGSPRTMTVTVNGAAQQVSLPATASWSEWATANVAVTTVVGANTVAVSYGSADNGNVNLDSATLTADDSTPTPEGTAELESGFLGGGAVPVTTAGATGSGAVSLPGTGARVVRTINQAAAGTATITLRYTASVSGTVTTYVNGVKGAQLSLTGGSGWRTATHTAVLRTGLNIVGYGDATGAQLDNIAVTGSAALAARGATVPFTTYEAEAGTTTGAELTPARQYTTDVAEASGRSAVKLTGTGQHVQITLTRPANALTVRASVPDGTSPPLAVYAGGTKVGDLSLTSKYSWMYGAYPFAEGPGGARPHRYFDDARILLPQTYPAGTVLRLAKDTTASSHITVDLVDAEVAAATTSPAGYVDARTHGANPGDGADDSAGLRAAIAAAQGTAAKGVWLPAGAYNLNSLVNVSGVDVRGAGIWHTVLNGADRRGGFAITGPGTTIADLTFDGDVTTRDPDDAPNSDSFIEVESGSASTVFNVATNHAKTGLWLKQADGFFAAGLRVRNTMADGLNVNGNNGPTANVRVEQSTFRNTGDDGMAMWSWDRNNTVSRSVFAFNTISLPILANGAAIYGGTDNRIEDSLISDTVFNGAGIMVSSWHEAKPFGGTTTVQRTTLTRAGTRNWDWNTHTGAVWLFAERADITGAVVLQDLDITDAGYHGMLFSWSKAITNLTVDNVRISGTGGATDAFTDDKGVPVSNAGSHGMHFNLATGTGRFDRVTVAGVKGAGSQGVANDENRYTVQRGTGNSGW
ncbi:carbohydrate-binding protein [Lentzea flaviverrucosa]|uniref:Carbohydrate binding module (Family 6) n=1 Tax=Lentzea flaviverrucosa TaxID=200379 RepID=A0A1H9XEU7_9PSEU|nr:CBM35 domain-containing protein [Lentzea flaviverrucosa]RDI21531.1 carbohydrate binding protein with CBM6 domain [Lentzea flaviverrucosa]SES44387.1 Carbohydrate binding module (family 6) [Lentzea flaviverrucosa]